jgi:hypothetical protein
MEFGDAILFRRMALVLFVLGLFFISYARSWNELSRFVLLFPDKLRSS